MPKGKRRIRDEFWFAVIFLGLLAFALLADWWEEHAVIGWTVVGVLFALLVFLAYRFASIRGWLGHTAKSATKKVIFKDRAPDREPIPPQLYHKVMDRANYRCQNLNCRYRGKPEVHHINMDHSDNRLSNLIALCPNCHTDAHRGKYSTSQLRNWSRISHST